MSAPPLPPLKDRIIELDVLRGFAALSVLFFHYTQKFQDLYGHAGTPLFMWPEGHYGVQFFFIISGFVIFMTLTRTKRPMDFVVSRFSRLYPAYWAAMTITFLVVLAAGLPKREAPLLHALVNVTMFQEALGLKHIDGAYWSLQVELYFYAWMFLLFSTRLLKRVTPIFIGWVTLSLVLVPGVKALDPGIGVPKLLRDLLLFEWVHLFALGILFFKLKERARWTPADILLLALCFYKQIGVRTSWSVFLIQGFALVFYLLATGQLRFLAIRPLKFLGMISYPLYLIHQNIGYVIIRTLEGEGADPTLAIACALVTAIGLATAITFLVERPVMNLIRRAWKAWRSPKPAPAEAGADA